MMTEQQRSSGTSGGEAAVSGNSNNDRVLLVLRGVLAEIDFRRDRLERRRAALYDALDAVVQLARDNHQPVEAVIIELKKLCADPRLASVHRLDRDWLTRHLVQRCIQRYYDASC